jgi:cytochrome d ubiquinol oxidase subunit I
MCLVATGSNISALWILIANGWMQHPVGFVYNNGRAELNDFAAVVFNKFAILEFLHVVPAAYLLAAFFVMGISAYHLYKKQHIDFFTRSFKIALVFGLVSSIWVVVGGDLHAVHVTETQPTKLAAMEAHWETQKRAPIVLFAVPDEESGRNLFEVGKIPGVLSLLGHHDVNAEVKGLNDFPEEDWPPVLLTFIAFRTMVAIGTLLPLLTIMGFFLKNRLVENRWYLIVMMAAVPLPYIAVQAGWVLAEVGRQPWIVYGLMRTADAVSPVTTVQVISSLVAFILVYGLLGAVGYYLIGKNAIKGPEPAESA